MDLQIDHLPESGRFQVEVQGQLCVADYQLRGDTMLMTHTGVAPELQGHGIAAALVQAALDHARVKGFKVNPLCSYVRVYMRRHPETLSLLA